MPLPVNSLVIWAGTNASIPANFSEETSFADRYLQGAGNYYSGPANGGATTHGHTVLTHTHTGNSHTHTFSSSSTAVGEHGTAVPGGSSATPSARGTHSHITATTVSATLSYGSTVMTIDAAGADPPAVKILFITPVDGTRDIPASAVCFTDETSISGFSATGGAGGTPNLDAKFLKATSSGGNSDLTGLGALTHNHTSPTHTHTIVDHQHNASNSGTASALSDHAGTGLVTMAGPHHTVVAATAALSDLSSDAATISSSSSEPEYYTLLGIQNTSGSAALPDGVIVPYFGALSAIPRAEGWAFCDGSNAELPDLRDKQIKVTSSAGSIGATGGSATHNHTGNHGHTHTGSHTHSAGRVTVINSIIHGTGAPNLTIDDQTGIALPHTHGWTFSSTTPTLQNANVTISSSDVRMPYRTVVFIKKLAPATVWIKGNTLIQGGLIK